MKRILLSFASAAVFSGTGIAGVNMQALTTFGGGDGWLSPAEYSILDNTPADTTRGIACNPVTGNLLVLTRDGGLSIRILDGATGTQTGTMSVTGISGGTFTGNHIAVADDGVIYACNLASPVSSANPFKIYRWAEEGEAPVMAVSSSAVTAGRLGDSFNVFGSGTGTLLVAGESNSSGTGTRNGFGVFSTTDGINFTATQVTFGTNPPAAGDFRLGITFLDSNTVMGAATSSNFRVADFTGGTGTLMDSTATSSSGERPMDYAVIGGTPLLATVDTNSALVRIYNMTDPFTPVLAASLNLTTGTHVTNNSGLGAVSWGPETAGSARLYALDTNNGIQAFTVIITPDTVPPAFASSPGNRTVYDRGQTTFTASATGTPPPTYQWFFNNDPIPGAASASLTINPVSPTSAGSYFCRATNMAGTADSAAATLAISSSVNTAALTPAWALAPGSRSYLAAAGDTERGLDYHPASNRLFIASRAFGTQVLVLDGTTGADLHQLDMTGVSGGNFTVMSPGINADGAIYVCNLSNTVDGSSFKIYKWATDVPGVPPVTAYDGNPVGSRIGDSFDVRGSGTATEAVAGARNSSQFVIFKEITPDTFTAYPITVSGAPVGTFALGIAFGEGNTVWGHGDGGALHYCSFDTATGTGAVIASYGPADGIPNVGVNPLGVDPVNRCLAMIDTGNSDNVRFFSYSADAVPVLTLLDQEFFSADNANGNRCGSVAIEAGRVYAFDTNNGVAVFSTLKPALPQLGAITPGPAGFFTAQVSGTPGFNYVVESFTDPGNWTTLTTVPFTAATHPVQLPMSNPRAQYRVRLGP